MRRGLLAVVVAWVVLSGVALAAAVDFRTGRYEEGPQSGFKKPGIRIDIHKHSFNVGRILMRETCTAPGYPAIHDFGGFQQDPQSTLRGPISSRGKLSGSFHDGQGGFVKVAGSISGQTLTVNGTEAGRYVPQGSS